MQPEEFWKEYVGSVSPREFLGGQSPSNVPELHARVAQHVAQLPALYGLALRRNWKKTWTGFGYNRDQVADGILRYLETKSAEWESTPDLALFAPKPAPTPVPQPETAVPMVEVNQLQAAPETVSILPAQDTSGESIV